MKKSILLASLLAAVALSACGKKEEAAPAAPAPAAAPARGTSPARTFFKLSWAIFYCRPPTPSHTRL